MKGEPYLGPEELLRRLARSQNYDPSKGDISRWRQPSEEDLSQLAIVAGMRTHDLFLIAEVPVPADALRFDQAASRELPNLVRRSLSVSQSTRQQFREIAQAENTLPEAAARLDCEPARQQYPPGFGSLLVRMLGLRNLGWSSAAKIMYMMSGVYVSAATVGAVGRGVKKIDADILAGFAAVLGTPVTTLTSLTEIRIPASPERSEEVRETAALLWDVRHLTAAQVRHIVKLDG